MPEDAVACNKHGIELARSGQLQEALGQFDQAVALKPDYAEAYNNRALILQDLNRPGDALTRRFRRPSSPQASSPAKCE